MGYGSELFLAPVDENLKCGVCLDVLKEPKSVCQEGHTFCADCIKSVTRSDSDFRFRCPICRGKPLEPPFATNRIVQNMVGAFAPRCPHYETTSTEEPPSQRQCTQPRRSRRGRADADADMANAQPRGCAWEGTCDDLAAHLRSCPFEAVPCKLGCGARLTPDQLDAHRDTCPRREVSCELCDKRLPLHKLEAHAKNECPEVMASCRFCGKEMLRKELGRGVPVSPYDFLCDSYDDAALSDHYRECPKIDLKCPIYHASLKLPIPLCSCRAKYKREDAAAHHSTFAHEHARTVRLYFDHRHGIHRAVKDALNAHGVGHLERHMLGQADALPAAAPREQTIRRGANTRSMRNVVAPNGVAHMYVLLC